MLLKMVTVTNSRGSVLTLLLEDDSSGISVKNIEGLDPVKATLVSSSFANMDGQQYQSSRREARNIKLSLGLEPDYGADSVKTLRDQLYGFFMPKTPTSLRFNLFDKYSTSVFYAAKNLDVDIDGYIETFESALFTKDPQVDISIMCFDPDFVDMTLVTVDGMTVADLTQMLVSYVGTVDTGVLFTISPDRALDEFTIFHTPPDGSLRTTDVSIPMVAGDVLKISSIPGSKSVVLTHLGTDSSVVYAVSPQSNWVELQPGDNNLRVYASGAPVSFSIEYNNRYGGL